MPQPESWSTLETNSRHRNEGIAALAAAIGSACAAGPPAMAAEIKAALARAAADPDILGAAQRATCADCYARHVVHSDPLGRFTIVAIAWGPGQFSPPHAHHSWCAYAVHENPLQETLFVMRPGTSAAEPVRTEVRAPGYSCFAPAGLDQIHRLGNPGATPAVSIHVYGVGREGIHSRVNRIVEVATERGSAP